MSYQAVTTVTIEIAGEQQRNIVSSARVDTAHVQVQLDGLWVTAIDREAVAAHAYAWNAATVEAATLLPPEAHITGIPRRMIATTILRQSGFVQPNVYRIKAEGKELAYLEVVVGALRVRAFDQAAVLTIAAAWERALETAQTIWTRTPMTIDPNAVVTLMGRRGRPAIVQDGLPPVQ